MLSIQSIEGVFCDAYLIDHSNNLVLGSFYARDTQLMNFISRIDLSVSRQSASNDLALRFIETSDNTIIHFPDNLTKLQERCENSLFGRINHFWIFTKSLLNSHQNIQSWVLSKDSTIESNQLWGALKHISPLPLLDEWQDALLSDIEAKNWLKPVQGYNLSAKCIDIANASSEFKTMISMGIKSGRYPVPNASVNNASATLSGDEWDVIHSYSRADAISDGTLIDVTQIAKTVGFIFDVAMTAESYHKCTINTLNQDEAIWNTLNSLYINIKQSNANVDRVMFQVDSNQDFIELKSLIGPGDDHNPVITIMLPGED